MPLVIAMIVLPIVGVWLVYEIVMKLCKASENAYEVSMHRLTCRGVDSY